MDWGGEELRLYLFFGSAVSSWLERNTWTPLSSPATISSKKWLKVGSVARRLFILVCTFTIISFPTEFR
jgi:hypothetical protein